MFNANNTSDALSYILSGLTEEELLCLEELLNSREGANFPKSKAERRRTRLIAGAFELDRTTYVGRVNSRLGSDREMDPHFVRTVIAAIHSNQFFEQFIDAGLDILRERQENIISGIKKNCTSVSHGHGFFGRLLDTNQEDLNGLHLPELWWNHYKMLSLAEVPIRAAIVFNNIMILGSKHDECFAAFEGIQHLNEKTNEELAWRRIEFVTADQEGFYTNRGRFVGREEAAHLLGTSGNLYSENTLQRLRKIEPVLVRLG